MNERDPLSEAELYQAFALLAEGSEQHPSPAALGAFAQAELAAAERDQIEAHLAACRECTDRALELRALAADAQPDVDLEPEALAAAVDAVVARAFPPAAPSPASLPGSRRQLANRLVPSLVAALFLAAAGLGLWAFSLASENSRLRAAFEPQAGAAVVDLYPGSFRPRGEEGPQSVSLPRAARWVTVLLTPPADAQAFTSYRLSVEERSGKPLWQGAVEPGESGSFSLLLPQRLAVGELRFRLLGVRGGSESLIEEYRAVFEEP